MLHAGFEDGGRVQEPGNAGSLQKLEKAMKRVLPWSLQKEHSPANALISGIWLLQL